MLQLAQVLLSSAAAQPRHRRARPFGGRIRVRMALARGLIRKPSPAKLPQGCVAKMHMLRHPGLRGLASVFTCVRARFHHFRA